MTPPASKPSLSARDRLIVALDVPSAAEAQKLVAQIGDRVVVIQLAQQDPQRIALIRTAKANLDTFFKFGKQKIGLCGKGLQNPVRLG